MHYIAIFIILFLLSAFVIKIMVYHKYAGRLNVTFGIEASKLGFALFRTIMAFISLAIFTYLVQHYSRSNIANNWVLFLPIIGIFNWIISITIFYGSSNNYIPSAVMKAIWWGILASLYVYVIAFMISFFAINLLGIIVDMMGSST